MITNLTKEDLISFEQEIAEIYKEGNIKAPIHLRSGYETQLLTIFENIREQDHIFGFWDLHLPCLLKGVPREELKEEIIKGNSIALQFPKYRVMGSGIVGSLNGVGAGLAWAIRQQNKDEFVHVFLGDMQAECGIVFEAVKYAYNFNLPIRFYILDNGVSVLTDTEKTWGYKSHNTKWWRRCDCGEIVTYYRYKNGWPHSGVTEGQIRF